MANLLNRLRIERRAEQRHAKAARRLIRRCAEAGYTHADIADALGVTPQAVSKHLRKGRREA